MKIIWFYILTFLIAGDISLAQSLKMGYVNSKEIFSNFPEAIKAQDQLNAIADTWYAKIDSMNNELSKEYETLQNQFNSLPEEKQQEAANQLKNKQQTIDKYKFEKFNQNNGEFYFKQKEMLDPIRSKIFDAIQKVANQESINYVFDKNVDVFVLYADSTLNITDKVLSVLNKK